MIPADGSATGPAAISANGRFIVFTSAAGNLVDDDHNGIADLFVHDSETGITERANLAADGGEADAPAFPVAGVSDDAVSGTLELVSASTGAAPGWGRSTRPQISDDGRYVLFVSEAEDLVAGDTNLRTDLFLRDMQLLVTQRASVSGSGGQLADPSAGLVDFSLSCGAGALSSQGRHVVFATAAAADPTDTNAAPDVYRFDRIAGTTQRVSQEVGAVAPFIYSLCPTVSASGERIAWWSQAADVAGSNALYLRDLGSGSLQSLLTHTTLASGFSGARLALPGDGRRLHFASNILLPGSRYSHVYRFDTDDSVLALLSDPPETASGPFANDHSNDAPQPVGSGGASASANGRVDQSRCGGRARRPSCPGRSRGRIGPPRLLQHSGEQSRRGRHQRAVRRLPP